MKKILSFILIISMMGIASVHSRPGTINSRLCNLEIKKCNKAIFNIVTYDKDGNLLKSGNGFFISEDGIGVAAYSLFEDAYQAEVIDYKGNKLKVIRILGANSNYDLVKFSTEGAKKIEAFEISTATQLVEGQTLSLISYTGKKKTTAKTVAIEKADDFEKYKYFEIATANNDSNIGYPLVDYEGNVVAILQKNLAEKATNACAIDARFINDMNITYASILNSDLTSIHISKGIPSTQSEALTYIYMIGNADSLTAINALNDFINKYPKCADGYATRGKFYANHKAYEQCEEDYIKALELSQKEDSQLKEDEIRNSLSKIIYNKALYNPNPIYKDWTFDRALEEVRKAYEINPSSFYLLQQGHCYFAKKEYKEAYNCYYAIHTKHQDKDTEWSPRSKAELWIFASEAYQMYMSSEKEGSTKEDSLHVITLLDSAIQELPRPYSNTDAPYFLNRARHHESMQNWRKAVLDYNEYEKIIGPKNLNDKFYFLREQAELNGHMYQQALDDIRTAIAYNAEDPFYPIEEAVILLKAGMFTEAIKSCEKSLKMLPENPDCYKIIGIAYGELGNKNESLRNLRKAKDLGDTGIDSFIEKYK